MEQKQTNGMAVASLVLGIVSAVCIFFGYFASYISVWYWYFISTCVLLYMHMLIVL